MSSIRDWAPRVPLRPQDHLISSAYSKCNPFKPCYENDPVDMKLLMENAYSRMWLLEKVTYQKRTMDLLLENNAFLMRRYVIRGLHKKLKKLADLRKEPSKYKFHSKKVPYAVRLLPKDAKKRCKEEPAKANEEKKID